MSTSKTKKAKILTAEEQQDQENQRRVSDCFKDFYDDCTHLDMAKLVKELNGNIVCGDLENSLFYRFNQSNGIWEMFHESEFNIMISTEVMPVIISAHVKYLKDSKSPEEKKFIEKKFKTLRKNAKTGPFLENVRKLLAPMIYDKDFRDKLNKNPWHVNFKNGVFDFSSFEKDCFRQRKKEDYVSHVLDYDYKPMDDYLKGIMEDLRKKLIQIHNDNEESMEASLKWRAYCLLGYKNLKHFKIDVGHRAENGKSSEANMFYYCFTIYCHKFSADFFKLGYSKRHKDLFELLTRPVRYGLKEELDESSLDIDYIKMFVDAEPLPVEILYSTIKYAQNNMAIEFISNHSPQFKACNGFLRRIWLETYRNRFLQQSQYDEEVANNGGEAPNGVYLADLDFIDKFKNDVDYKLAFFHLLRPHCRRFCKYKVIEDIPKNWTEDAKDLHNENDKMKFYIDTYYNLVKDSEMGKIDFIDHYHNANKNKTSWPLLLNDLKRLGYEYKKDGRDKDKNKGIIIGLQLKEDNNNNILD